MSMTRRDFLKRSVISGVTIAAAVAGTGRVAAAAGPAEALATIIDLTLCDGCPDVDIPRCVSACRSKNQGRFPQPLQPIADYWPQTQHEDWSAKQGLTDRLTPYNWTYVQHVQVEQAGLVQDVHIPRRCMHCDTAPCAALCPFGVIEQSSEGAVLIDTSACFGGAKCRDVCPWHIPQRQAGVGLYLEIAPDLAGGGVMYKCDLCADRLQLGQDPVCVTGCPTGALKIGLRSEMDSYARIWLEENGGYIYGRDENGGTSTWYLSTVPFEAIDRALHQQEMDGRPGRPALPAGVDSPLESVSGLASSMLLAPVAGIAAAGITVYQIMTRGEEMPGRKVRVPAEDTAPVEEASALVEEAAAPTAEALPAVDDASAVHAVSTADAAPAEEAVSVPVQQPGEKEGREI